MTFSGFALVLAAALCHATWNFFVKRINGGPELVWLFSVVTAVIYLPFAVYVWVTAKPDFGVTEIMFVVGSTVLHMAYFLLLQVGYRKGDLSVVYPTARATGPFLSTGFAVLFLGETMTMQIALGAGIVIIGIVNLTGGFRSRSKHLTISVVFGLAVGLLIGSYTVWDAYAVSVLMIPPLLVDYFSSAVRSVVLAPVGLKRMDKVRMHWRDHRNAVLTIAILNPLAYILVLYALTFTPVVFVAPTREISVLLTVLMGSILLNEGHLRERLAWSCVILAGVVLLATA